MSCPQMHDGVCKSFKIYSLTFLAQCQEPWSRSEDVIAPPEPLRIGGAVSLDYIPSYIFPRPDLISTGLPPRLPVFVSQTLHRIPENR